MANYILGRIPEMRDLFILVDPFERKDSTSKNLAPTRQALACLKNGGILGVFPAGEVAHIQWNNWRVQDPRWSDFTARLIRKSDAVVIPAFFTGYNSVLFQAAGLLHPRLRTAMLPRELFKKVNKTIDLRFGRPIGPEKAKNFKTDEDLTRYLRWRTEMLGRRKPDLAICPQASDETARTPSPKSDVAALEEELARLSPEQFLTEHGDFSVHLARTPQIPRLLQEIGRLRELTFREVGEGTGREVDLDRYDEYYQHLFVWNRAARELVGGYRLGMTDRIVKEQGLKGIYTHSLFKYDRRFLSQINPALELGRSFVRKEYQKTYQALMLLWKGIGRVIAMNPSYNVLFGPVSITRDYDPVSRRLIAAFFQEHNHREDLAGLVKPRTPLKKAKGKMGAADPLSFLEDIQTLSEAISDIEADQKGIPILLKHYVKLGGKSVGFNVDHDFSDVLDALIIVDLLQTDRRILERYMGRDAARSFLSHNQAANRADFAA
jgi:putative hemolysin